MRLLNNNLVVGVLAGLLGIAMPTAPVMAAASMPETGPARDVDVSVSLFFDDLAVHGEWISHDRYGHCWRPSGVAVTWRPYTVGHWSYSDDCGWLWVSYEPHGWATCHYGRWFYDDYYDCWMWVPGTTWAPAWVAWRTGGGYCGWRPLPPECGWSASTGLIIGNVNLAVEFGSPHWSFCEERYILQPRIETHIIVAARNVTYIERTRDITVYKAPGGRVFNRGIEPERIERVVGKKVERVKIRDVSSPASVKAGKSSSREVAVFRPNIKSDKPDRKPVNRPDARQNMPPAEREKRIQEDQRNLSKQQEAERKRLQDLQRQEADRPPNGAKPDTVKRDHEREREMQKQQQQREQERVKKQHSGERPRPPAARPQKPEGSQGSQKPDSKPNKPDRPDKPEKPDKPDETVSD